MAHNQTRLSVNQMLTGFLILSAGFFLCLAVMDFTIMHGQYGNYPDWLYRYWMALGLVVVSFACLASWMTYAAGLPKKRVPAVFAIVILLFIAGLLDIFYYMLATIKGETYSFEIWSAQYKWFGYWDWPRQILWTLACFAAIAYIWHKTKD